MRHTITLTVTTIQGRHVPPTDLLACIVAVKGRQAPTGRSTLLGVLRRWASHSRDKTSDILLKTTQSQSLSTNYSARLTRQLGPNGRHLRCMVIWLVDCFAEKPALIQVGPCCQVTFLLLSLFQTQQQQDATNIMTNIIAIQCWRNKS